MPSSDTPPNAVRTALSSQTNIFIKRAASVALLVLACDQLLKTAVRSNLDQCMVDSIANCDRVNVGGLDVVYVVNAGSIFGFGQGLWAWGAIALVGILLILVYGHALRTTGWIGALAVGMQAGGAFGNLVDRLAVGGGIDFLSLPSLSLIINLADVALLVGMPLAVIALVQVRAFR